MTDTAQELAAPAAINRPLGFLFGPLKWAAPPIVAMLQNQPQYFSDLIHLSRARMHLIGIALAHVRKSSLNLRLQGERQKGIWLLLLSDSMGFCGELDAHGKIGWGHTAHHLSGMR